MGAKLNGLRRLPLNDNLPKLQRGLDEIPIPAEDFRRPPMIERETGFRWYCLVTGAMGEYRCAEGLSDLGIASYVPTETKWVFRTRGRERRREQVQSPLFRAYVFARLSHAFVEAEGTFERRLVLGPDWTPIYERDAFLKNPLGILGVMSNYGTPSPMPLRDAHAARSGLSDLADDERAGWFDERRVAALVAGKNAKPRPVVMKGEEVRLTAGPLASFQGVAENDNDKTGVRVSVEIFGRSTPVFVPIADLENLTRPNAKADVAVRRA
jgi:transcription antitermination factor NusG